MNVTVFTQNCVFTETLSVYLLTEKNYTLTNTLFSTGLYQYFSYKMMHATYKV